MDKIFQRLMDGDLTEVNGFTVDAGITVSEELANEIVALIIEDTPQVESCRVKIHAENRIALDVKSSLWPWPLQVKLRLFRSVDVADSLRLRAFLENHLLLGKLGSLLKLLPDGIQFYEDQVSIDLSAFASSHEQSALLSWIKTAEISTEEGRLLVDVGIRK